MKTKSQSLEALQNTYHANSKQMLEDFLTFLRFQSISSEAPYQSQMQACAEWLKKKIQNIGMSVEIWENDGPPTLFASWLKAGPDKPTLLIYNHYDVQPVDPLTEWHSPPFEPTIRDGQIYARGAQDNKGQCFYVYQALKILMEKEGSLPVNIKWCIDGEEEHGSACLAHILDEKKTQLKADYLAIVDMGLRNAKTPAVTLGVRGLVCMDLELHSSKIDLHSGSHGGIICNPLHALVDLLAKVRDSHNGKILIPGFYDDVIELTSQEKSLINFSFDTDEYQKMFGKPTGGENQFSPPERAWTRPTFEINGITGGYGGSGFKTVIPAKASAKISCRLVPNQDPEKMGKLVEDFLKQNAPEGVEVIVNVHAGHGKAVRANPFSPIVKAFSDAYSEIFQAPCEYIYEGGSIPIVTQLAEVSQSEVVLMGMGLADDQIHAPNEHFGIDRLEKGFLVIARTLELLGE